MMNCFENKRVEPLSKALRGSTFYDRRRKSIKIRFL
ncbi:hypothetical protein CLOLEP_02211 [[Clostridium] leptum DSM 753]|uniref:Uncharacterized protein n=1 Tax=[Clostridium] leptum DSM 753 TaxID=428125 RepID=A7VUG5_9FIRM|nr:hypothetical protein CLOLEP_02211 [[Clostridium] leptum DSM 753]